MKKGIQSFPLGSAGGPDLLSPQHLLDMTSRSAGEGGLQLLQALTSFCNFALAGKVTEEIRPFFFGASLLALRKKDGGVRPITIGLTLRRLIAKVGCMSVVSRMEEHLSPLQLGYGTRLGAEAAIHSARTYLRELQPDYVMIKLDFQNAFNSVRRDKVLEAARVHIPELYPYVFSCYSQCSLLFYENTIIPSQEGVQQGDPLGPLLFCLVIHPLVKNLKSELKIFYLDDGLLGSIGTEVLNDITRVQEEAAHLGLHLNLNKSELICDEPHNSSILQSAPDLIPTPPEDAVFLGAPIGDHNSVDAAIITK